MSAWHQENEARFLPYGSEQPDDPAGSTSAHTKQHLAMPSQPTTTTEWTFLKTVCGCPVAVTAGRNAVPLTTAILKNIGERYANSMVPQVFVESDMHTLSNGDCGRRLRPAARQQPICRRNTVRESRLRQRGPGSNGDDH